MSDGPNTMDCFMEGSTFAGCQQNSGSTGSTGSTGTGG
jgi:hypothetical protein